MLSRNDLRKINGFCLAFLIPPFDTAAVKEKQTDSKPDKLWKKTQHANLWRYVPSGTLYARVRVKGKLIVQSLKTDVVDVGKLRLADLDKTERAGAEKRGKKGRAQRLTFGGALEIYKTRMEGDPELKPKTKAYYRERINALLRSWPDLKETNVRDVNNASCEAWAGKFRATCSPTAYNNTVAVLKAVFDLACDDLGARYGNPAEKIKRTGTKPKKLSLPSQSQFNTWVEKMETLGDGWCRKSANLVRFLAYGGFRKMEAANIAWNDCDFERGLITVRGDAETGTKNSEERKVPMIPEMRAFLERIKPADAIPSARVMDVAECQQTMTRAAAKIGMARITHHDLRHLFATRCIESGVDIPTVSRWLGHKDGGALAMKTYGHLRDDHSVGMAAKVNFGGAK
jgi:integrase